MSEYSTRPTLVEFVEDQFGPITPWQRRFLEFYYQAKPPVSGNPDVPLAAEEANNPKSADRWIPKRCDSPIKDVDYLIYLRRICSKHPPGPLWARKEKIVVEHRLGWCPGRLPCTCRERFAALVKAGQRSAEQ